MKRLQKAGFILLGHQDSTTIYSCPILLPKQPMFKTLHDNKNVSWKDSSLRQMVQKMAIENLPKGVIANVVPVSHYSEGSLVQDYFFIPSIEEVCPCQDSPDSLWPHFRAWRNRIFTDKTDTGGKRWWVRTPDPNQPNSFLAIKGNGAPTSVLATDSCYVLLCFGV